MACVGPVCIDSKLLGTAKHLVKGDDGSFSWSPVVPLGAWHLDGTLKEASPKCLDTALRLAGAELDLSPPAPFVASVEPFLAPSGWTAPPPWQALMPERAHRAFVERLVSATTVAMAKADTSYYESTWVPGGTVLRALQPARVDAEAWKRLLSAGAGNVPAIESFAPDRNGFARPIAYDRFGTLTGRLTVKSGPQILTLKREHRDIVAPSAPGGSVYYLDFAALEARVLLYEYGYTCDHEDMYAALAGELSCTRDAVKGAVISELYGSSRRALGKILGIEGRELSAFVKKVKQRFRTSELLARIKQQFVATGCIQNRYGRRVLVDEPLDNIMVNYYAQSTGADVALLGFSSIVDQLRISAPGVRPLFVLHDALFLDVPPGAERFVEQIREVRVKGYVQRFFIRCEKLGVHGSARG